MHSGPVFGKTGGWRCQAAVGSINIQDPGTSYKETGQANETDYRWTEINLSKTEILNARTPHENHGKPKLKTMNIKCPPSFALTATLLAFTCASIPNTQAASLVSSVSVGASNNPQTFRPFEPAGSNSSETGAAVSSTGSSTFTGLNRNGEEAIMTFSGSGTASASYGMLRTAASGSVSGVYYNETNSPYYYQDEESEAWITDPQGSPTFLVSYGQAQFNDTLNYGSIPAGFKTNFWLNISGSFTGTDVYHSVYVEFGTQTDSIVLYPVDGANQLWTTDNFTPLPGVDLSFSTTVLSSFNFYPEHAPDGGSYSGIAEFMNTVTIAAINVYDQNDNLVSGWSPTSGSGTVYPVPEPSGMVLVLAAVIGFAARRRRA